MDFWRRKSNNFFYLCFDILLDMGDIRERFSLLFDEGSFEEFPVSGVRGVLTGRGNVEGRVVYAYAHDSSVSGGAMSKDMAMQICKLMDQAQEEGAPIVSLNESVGARIQDGVGSLAGYGEIFRRNIRYSGVIPQLSCILGPCAGGAVYSPALTDFTVMVQGSSFMFVTGPSVVKAVIGESVGLEELGGAAVHSMKSGVAHYMASDEKKALEWVRELLSFLPSNNKVGVPLNKDITPTEITHAELAEIVPDNPSKAYDMLRVVRAVVDAANFFEVHGAWAKNILTGFARVGGRSVGIVANQPKVLAGVLDVNASRKAARFVRFCDAFNIPLVTFVDVPGFLCGIHQEHNAIITHGAKLLYAYGEATVPKITVTLRKSYGGAYITMSSKQLGGDCNYAWPSANVAVMGADAAMTVLSSGDLKVMGQLSEVVEQGYLDEVIRPEDTRSKIISALENLVNKMVVNPWRKHDNLPL